MKKLWVFGTSHTAGSCDNKYFENCYTKIIHDKTDYIVKNLAKPGISFESQIRYIYYFLEHLQEKPDSILIEIRGLSTFALGYMPNNILNDMYSYLNIIIRRFEDDINNNEYANIQPLYGNIRTREEVFFNGLTIKNSHIHREEWYQSSLKDSPEISQQAIETHLNVHDKLIGKNYMFIEQRLLSFYSVLLTIKNLGITPYWFFIDLSRVEYHKFSISTLIKNQLDSMYVGYFKNNNWLSFLDHIKLQDDLLCKCMHPNEKAHKIIANDLIPQLC